MVQLPWWHWGVAGGWAAFRAGGGGVRTRKRSEGAAGEGRGQSAEASAGSELAKEVQTRWRQ